MASLKALLGAFANAVSLNPVGKYDYFNYISITPSTTETTAVKDGLLVMTVTNLNAVTNLYVGARTGEMGTAFGFGGTQTLTVCAPVAKGQKYRVSATAGVAWIRFCPLVKK